MRASYNATDRSCDPGVGIRVVLEFINEQNAGPEERAILLGLSARKWSKQLSGWARVKVGI
eukprot:1139250-Pelagomonas_calceolata.AAC.8